MYIFEPISLDKQERYLELLTACGITASDYSFINLWGWAEEYGLEWAWGKDVVWIKQTRPENMYWSPVGRLKTIQWKKEIGLLGESNPSFTRVPQEVVLAWEPHFTGQMEMQEAREHWDYLYAVEDLVGLSGNKYHKKKNLLNQFIKKHEYQYLDLHPLLIGRTKEMQERWCVWRDCESSETLSAENRVIDRVLSEWDRLQNIMGGALIVNSELVAFCIAEAFTLSTLSIHFEKGFTEYSGIYQAMNQMFLAAHRDFTFVNREQDLDEEGLRKAKLSYHPISFVRKYHVVVKYPQRQKQHPL